MKLLSKVFRQSKNPADAMMSRLLEQSIENAGYWAKRMPREAAHLAQKVRLYTLASAVLSLTAGLLAWPVIAESSQLSAQVLVSALASLAAFTIIAPHAGGLSDRADESIKLCSAYSAIYHDLLDAKYRLATGSMTDASHAADIICRFQHIQERKDALALPVGKGHAVSGPAHPQAKRNGRRGRIFSGGMLGIARPLMPSVPVRLQNDPTAAVEGRTRLTALARVLPSRHASQHVPPHHSALTHTAHALPALPVRRRVFRASLPVVAGPARRRALPSESVAQP
ncbi:MULTISPECIES: hypothetical protein [unclassified Streptomyces]|uniref:hypothetical protein n=1 Tax=unclassified Streptomyces TaxID=2593676 RepID=UPI002E8058CF|nr:hypothetical protein [Streptomyces sp. NBC_00589]WTI38348.1 hypothetical protein OIC96_26845 [Streptomyces sp. NBC_00775]WUB33377.1 hypothetical protein OHA51_22890 [Streptomyces sp. NBC_00589]